MDKLKIETIPSGSRYMETKRISGFMEGELVDLKNRSHESAEQKLLAMLDERNEGTGT